VETIGPAAVGRVHGIGDEGVAGRGAQALAEPVQQPGQENQGPGKGQGQERLGDPGHSVPPADVGHTPAEFVTMPAGQALHEADQGSGHAFHGAQYHDRRPQGDREKQGHDGVDHFRSHVGEKTDPAEAHHGIGELPALRRILVHDFSSATEKYRCGVAITGTIT
jgi:hypothetical protein